MPAKLYRFEVTHPEHGRLYEDAKDEAEAINKAIKAWGGCWREDVAYCHAVKLGTAAKPRCRRCFREFGKPGDATAYCPECLRIMECQRRDAARFRPVRRRPGEG